MTLDKYREYVENFSIYQYVNKYPASLYDPIDYHLSTGGKKLRALLTLFAADILGGNMEETIPAAISVEYFHNFTLMHDDIMDNSPIRRGKKTVFKEYDTNTAILSGDVLMILAYKVLENIPQKHLSSVFSILNRTAIEVCQGQRLDIDFESKNHITKEEYIEMIRLKTSVLIGAALEIGAVMSDTTPEVSQMLYCYGVNLGIAFQMQDDILDCYGDTEKVGKTKGGDIIRNKKTFLLIHAIEKAKENKDITFLNSLERSDWTNDTEKVEYFMSKFKEYQSLENIQSAKDKLVQESLTLLNNSTLNSNQIEKLSKLVNVLVNREW